LHYGGTILIDGSKVHFHKDELDQQPERIWSNWWLRLGHGNGHSGLVAVGFLIDRSKVVREVIILDSEPTDIFDDTVIKMLDKLEIQTGPERW
jgi:hypothetical protein